MSECLGDILLVENVRGSEPASIFNADQSPFEMRSRLSNLFIENFGGF
jgi:hypothetical protein